MGCCENVWECATSVTQSPLGWGWRVPGHVGLGLTGSRSVPRQHQFLTPRPPACTGSHTRWCVESVAVMWGCHACRPDLIVTLSEWRCCLICRGRAWDGKWWQVRDIIRAVIGASLGMYRSMTRSHASPESLACKQSTPALASHVGLISTVLCVRGLIFCLEQSPLLEIV